MVLEARARPLPRRSSASGSWISRGHRRSDTGRMVLVHHGADGPATFASAPADRCAASTTGRMCRPPAVPLGDIADTKDIVADLLKLMASPDLASRRWIWEQYDHVVGADTVQRPGGDAAVVRVHGSKRAWRSVRTVRPDIVCRSLRGRQAGYFVETWRNITAPSAASHSPWSRTASTCASPHAPRSWGNWWGACEGMSEACIALDYPIVSGNVSLPNEDRRRLAAAGDPATPAIGGVGLMPDVERMCTVGFKGTGDIIPADWRARGRPWP